jgi:hypothetical protein
LKDVRLSLPPLSKPFLSETKQQLNFDTSLSNNKAKSIIER